MNPDCALRMSFIRVFRTEVDACRVALWLHGAFSLHRDERVLFSVGSWKNASENFAVKMISSEDEWESANDHALRILPDAIAECGRMR